MSNQNQRQTTLLFLISILSSALAFSNSNIVTSIKLNFHTNQPCALFQNTLFIPACGPKYRAISNKNSHENPPTSSNTNKELNRKKKKNKYSNFSKTDQSQMDPLEAMIAESNKKNQEIKKKQKSKKKTSTNPQRIAQIQKDDHSKNEVYKSTKMNFPDTRKIDPYDPTTYGFTELGTILGAHGVKGEMKIMASTGFGEERLCRAGIRHLKMPNRRSPREVRLKGGRFQMDNVFLIRIIGVEDRDAAKKLRGAVLYAKETEKPSDLEDDEYLISDLVGLEVFLDEEYKDEDFDEKNTDVLKNGKNNDLGGAFVGKVSGIILAEEMCSIPGLGNDLLEISLPRGQGGLPSWKDELVLVPFVPELVPRVDTIAKEIYIAPPPGLLDLTYYRQDNVRIKGLLPPARDD